MMPLDEVIKALESYPISPSTLPMSVMIVPTDDIDDALHYLREYREMKEHLACLDAATLHGDDTTKYRRRKKSFSGRKVGSGGIVFGERVKHGKPTGRREDDTPRSN